MVVNSACETVAVIRADNNAAHIDDGVSLGVAASLDSVSHIDAHPLGGTGVDEGVVAAATDDGVAACAALDDVIPVVAAEGVCVVGAGDVFNAGEGVACGVAPARGPVGDGRAGGRYAAGRYPQVYGHRGGRCRVAGGVVAAGAGDGVGAVGALEDVVLVVASEGVGVLGAGEVLDAGEGVALGVATAAGPGGQVDGHRAA